MEYFARHRTTYRYLQDVSHSWHLAHVRPRTTPLQAVHDSSIILSLETASRIAREDYFSNPCEWFSIDRPHTHLEVLAESRVTVRPAPQRTAATASHGKRCAGGWKIRKPTKSAMRCNICSIRP